MIDINEIKSNLKTSQLGKRIFFYENINSTNLEAQKLIDSSKAKFGDLIIAKTQSSGKGQNENAWSSPEGGLYISIITASKTSEFSNLITFAAGIACVEAIFSIAEVLTDLKWVNDILYNGNKLGGILTQSTTRGSLSTNITGIGINVNAEIENVSNKYKAASLLEITGHKIDINLLAAQICNYFEKYFNICQNNPDFIVKKWLEFSKIDNFTVNFEADNKKLSGYIKGINKLGHLVVIADEKMYTIMSTKDIEIIY